MTRRIRLPLFLALACALLAARANNAAPKAARPVAPDPHAPLNAMDFGAGADGVTDDTRALQAALDACKSNRTLYLPNGRYRVTRPLKIANGRQQTVRGDGLGTWIAFEGTYTDGLRCENVTNFTLRDLCISGPATIERGLHVTEKSDSAEQVLLENVYSLGFANAIAIGADTVGDVSEVTLLHVIGQGSKNAAFVVGNGEAANVLDVRFIGCTARNSAVGVLIAGGGCTWCDGAALGNSVSDFQMSSPPGHPVVIRGVRSEKSRRFWDYGGGHTYGTTVTLEGVMVASFDDPDGAVITHNASTPLTLIGCSFRAAPGKGKPTAMKLGMSKDHPLPFVAINVVADSEQPFGPPSSAINLLTLGCHLWQRGGSVQLLRRDGSTAPGPSSSVERSNALEVAQPPNRVQAQATIRRGKTSVVVEHGLGGEPAPEDVGIVSRGLTRVWLAESNEKTLTFRAERAAPAAGITFTYSASRPR